MKKTKVLHCAILIASLLGLSSLSWGTIAATEKANNPSLSLSLQEAINLALRNNPNVKSAQLQRVIDKFALQVADNEFEWRYRLTGNVFWNQNTGSGISTRSQGANVTPQASIKAPIGLEFQTQLPQASSDGSHYNPALSLSAKQPLLRGAGSKVNLAGLRNSYDQDEINKLTLRDTIINTLVSVIRDYRQLQQAQWSVEIHENNLKDAKVNLQQTQAKIDAGRLPPRDIVEIRRQIADQELQLENANNTRNQQTLIFLRDIWLDPHSPITLPKNIDASDDDLPALEPSFETALKQNGQYQTAVINLEQSKRDVIVANDNARWQLDLSAQHSFGGGSGGKNNARLDSLVNGDNNASRLQLDLDIPINNKPLQQGVVNAKTRLKQNNLRVELLKRELYDAVKTAIADLTSQRRQVQLSTEATELARQSLDLEKRKQLLGKATQLDVTQARRTLISAENTLVGNKIQYLNTLTEFRRLLGITLEHWQVELQY